MQFKPHSLRLVGFTSAALLASSALLAGCSDDASVGNAGAGATGSGTGATTGAGAGAGTGAGAGAGTGAGGATGSGGNVTGGGGTGNTGNGGTGNGGTGNGGTGNGGTGNGGTGNGGDGGTGAIDTKPNAKPGDMSNVPQDYLRLGEIRILNNNWGSAELQAGGGCMPSESTMSIFVNQDKRFGWTFDRQDCDKANSNQKPDFPQIEFGVHPFGKGSTLATSPDFSSTTLLPKKISEITSASVTIEGLEIQLQSEANWNITFEFWLSQNDPLQPNAGVYAELMTFWGWENDRWPAMGPGMNGSCDGGSGCGQTVSTGGKTYTLWVQRDNWGEGWRYFQFRDNGGPNKSFNGKIDVKPLLDYLVNNRNYSTEYYVTRLEVGSEIDDNTKGTVSMSNVTFEVNGEMRSPEFGQ